MWGQRLGGGFRIFWMEAAENHGSLSGRRIFISANSLQSGSDRFLCPTHQGRGIPPTLVMEHPLISEVRSQALQALTQHTVISIQFNLLRRLHLAGQVGGAISFYAYWTQLWEVELQVTLVTGDLPERVRHLFERLSGKNILCCPAVLFCCPRWLLLIVSELFFLINTGVILLTCHTWGRLSITL